MFVFAQPALLGVTGKEYEHNGWSIIEEGCYDEKTHEFVEVTGAYTVQFLLEDYQFDTVYLPPSFPRTVHLATPIEIEVQ